MLCYMCSESISAQTHTRNQSSPCTPESAITSASWLLRLPQWRLDFASLRLRGLLLLHHPPPSQLLLLLACWTSPSPSPAQRMIQMKHD